MTKRLFHLAALAVAISASASSAHAQSLANKISSAGDRSVQFSFPARPGVCGDGRTYISTGSGNFYGSVSSHPPGQWRAALAGLGRSDAPQLDKIGAALVQIATNENDVQQVRTQALSVLSRLDHGAGIQPLVQLASGNMTSWIGRESLRVLSGSGDPRA